MRNYFYLSILNNKIDTLQVKQCANNWSKIDFNKVTSISLGKQKKAFLKNKINNYFVPKIGFSDDDLKNVEVVKKHFEDDPENIIKTYSTAGGIKKEY
jgi:hypothetical protein